MLRPSAVVAQQVRLGGCKGMITLKSLPGRQLATRGLASSPSWFENGMRLSEFSLAKAAAADVAAKDPAVQAELAAEKKGE